MTKHFTKNLTGLFGEEAIQPRHCVRDYSGEPSTLGQLALLLHSA